MVITIVLLIVGFILLVGGADYLVKGASSLAKRLKISDLIIGLTIVSIGTSAPELAVNIIAGIEGSSGLAIGNVLGSNLFNVLLILGITALLRPLPVRESLVKREAPFLLLITVLLLFLAADSLFGPHESILSGVDGAILLLIFLLFLYSIFREVKSGAIAMEEEEVTKEYSIWLTVVMLLGGIVALLIGGEMIVRSASKIAFSLGVSETVIGLTVVAFGTSLPELATSVVATLRGNSDIAVGNVVGSNIFNLLLILGVGSLISPIPFLAENIVDLWVNIGATLLLLAVLFIGRRRGIDRWEGGLLVIAYLLYLISIFYR